MGQFSNGTEGEIYYATYCETCVHDDPDNDTFCAVWGMHLMNQAGQDALDILIPIKDGVNQQCAMYHKATQADKYQDPHVNVNRHLVGGKLVF